MKTILRSAKLAAARVRALALLGLLSPPDVLLSPRFCCWAPRLGANQLPTRRASVFPSAHECLDSRKSPCPVSAPHGSADPSL